MDDVPSVSRETLEGKHAAYIDLVIRWSKTISLVARGERNQESLWAHVNMCRAVSTLLPTGTAGFLDLGSGNGLPAIPVVIESGQPAELMEADQRKAAFLQVVASRLDLPITVTVARIEETPARSSPCVMARALAPLPRLLPLVHRHLAPDGYALLLKPDHSTAEMEAAQSDWLMDAQQLALGRYSSVWRVSRLRRRNRT